MQKNLGYVIPSIVIPDETNKIGYWYLGNVPLGARATGTMWTIGNDHYWYVDGTKTDYLAEIPIEVYNQQWTELKQTCNTEWSNWLSTTNADKNAWFNGANALLNAYEGQFSDMLSEDTAEFTEWFDRIQGQLTEDAAGNLQTEVDQINQTIEGLDSALVPKGSITKDELPAFDDIKPGWMYNITHDFTSDSRFIDGGGKSYAADSNVYFVQIQTGTQTVVKESVTKNDVTMTFNTATDNSFILDGTKKAADAIKFDLSQIVLNGDSYKITLSTSGDISNLITLRLIGMQGNTETQLYTSNALGEMDVLLTAQQLDTYDKYYLKLFLASGSSKIFTEEEYSITVHNVTQDTDVSIDLKHVTQPVYANYWDVLTGQKYLLPTGENMSSNGLHNTNAICSAKGSLALSADNSTYSGKYQYLSLRWYAPQEDVTQPRSTGFTIQNASAFINFTFKPTLVSPTTGTTILTTRTITVDEVIQAGGINIQFSNNSFLQLQYQANADVLIIRYQIRLSELTNTSLAGVYDFYDDIQATFPNNIEAPGSVSLGNNYVQYNSTGKNIVAGMQNYISAYHTLTIGKNNEIDAGNNIVIGEDCHIRNDYGITLQGNDDKDLGITNDDGSGRFAFAVSSCGNGHHADDDVATDTDYGDSGYITGTATIKRQLEPKSVYLLLCSSYTLSNGSIYGATARMITTHGLPTGTPSNLSLGQTTNAPATIAFAANNVLTIKNGAAARTTIYHLIRIL